MILQLVLGVGAIAMGVLIWFPINYALRVIMNISMTNYPQYYSGLEIQFTLAIMSFGIVLLIIVPTALWVWSNIQNEVAYR